MAGQTSPVDFPESGEKISMNRDLKKKLTEKVVKLLDIRG